VAFVPSLSWQIDQFNLKNRILETLFCPEPVLAN
jgi:hypothetical protein